MARPKVDRAGMFVDGGEALAPTQTLSGRYELIGRLGAGGMAELFLARLVGLDGFEKFVVVKRILAARATDPDFMRMFEDEARIAATLEHPNIVTTHDIGRDGDDVFFTMEYLHGETVRRVLAAAKKAEQPFPVDLALQIAIGCAAGLEYAHAHCDYRGKPLGIVHRDVSPSNVVVTYQSGVKLIDFGIAKAASGKHVTDAGVVKGKAAYMSPEQCKGGAIDRRSDVFCLGIILYEMLTGERPFRGEHVLAIMGNVVSARPEPPSVLRPGIPRELDAIVMRALAKNPDDRFMSAFAVQEALELFTRQYRMHALPGALGRYLEHLLGPKPYPWVLVPAAATVAPPPPVVRSFVTTPRQRIDEAMPISDAAIELVTASVRGPQTSANDAGVTAYSPSDSVSAPSRPPRAAPRPWGWIGLGLGTAAAAAVLAFGLPWGSQSTSTSPTPTSGVATSATVPTSPPGVASAGAPAADAAVATPSAPAPAAAPPTVAVPPGVPAVVDDDETIDVLGDEPEAPVDGAAVDPRKQRRAQAQRALARAQDLAYPEPKAAMAAVKQSIELYPTRTAYELMGVIACRIGDAKAALRAHAQLKGDRQAQLRNVCKERGIVLPP